MPRGECYKFQTKSRTNYTDLVQTATLKFIDYNVAMTFILIIIIIIIISRNMQRTERHKQE